MTTAQNEARIAGADPDIRPDSRDQAILEERRQAYDAKTGPMVGDWVRFRDGSLHRFSHNWGDSLQTSPGGSWYLGPDGFAGFSGALDPGIPLSALQLTEEQLPARFWFFHHGFWQAHSAVHATMPVRVYSTRLFPDRKP